MIRDVDVSSVRRLVEEGAQLVEVLPDEEYESEHLPGAVHLPLRRLGRDARSVLDPARAVVVYCYDAQCDLSPRAAWRLETLGFGQVYDFVTGKVGWLAAGLPTEGRDAGEPRIGALVADVATCALDADLASLPEGRVVVVDSRGVVLGVVPADRPSSGTAADVMREGPSTFRPNVPVGEMRDYLAEHDLDCVLVTRADGTLVGGVDAATVASFEPYPAERTGAPPRVHT
jgi:rhodanese-related sulfurtransferase